MTDMELKKSFILFMIILLTSAGCSVSYGQTTTGNPVSEMVQKFFGQLDSHFREKQGIVIKVAENTVYINLGEKDQVVSGDRFTVLRTGERISDPRNPDNFGFIMNRVNDITADIVQDSISSCILDDTEHLNGMPAVGDTIRTKQPYLKLAFAYQERELPGSFSFLQMVADILSYKCEKTGRYTVYPTEKFREALSMGDTTGNWSQKLMKTASWLNIDVIVTLQLSETNWDLSLNGSLLSVPDQRVIDYILSTIPKNPQITSILSDIHRQETFHSEEGFALSIPETTVGDMVLDACTYDVNNDGKDELFVLLPEGIYMYYLKHTVLQDPVMIMFPRENYSGVPRKNVLGKLCVCDLDGDSAAECYARTSIYNRGYRWLFQDESFKLYDSFNGYPVGAENTSSGNALMLAKPVRGKDYFSGDLYYQYPLSSEPRNLNDPDRVIGPFYNFSTMYDVYTENLVRIFLDLDNHIHFMTSTGGAYNQDRYFGTGMSISDIDNDHKPDMFVSSASMPGEEDYVIHFEIENNTLQERWTSEPGQGSIYVIATGDIDGNTRPDLIVFREFLTGSKISTVFQVYSY